MARQVAPLPESRVSTDHPSLFFVAMTISLPVTDINVFNVEFMSSITANNFYVLIFIYLPAIQASK
jgi:hypothetical protein